MVSIGYMHVCSAIPAMDADKQWTTKGVVPSQSSQSKSISSSSSICMPDEDDTEGGSDSQAGVGKGDDIRILSGV